MKNVTHFLFVTLFVLGALAAAPVAPVRADCQEIVADDWYCTGSDSDGLDAGTGYDYVTVEAGATVDNPTVGGTAILMTDGDLYSEGAVSNNEDGGTAIFASGTALLVNAGGSVSANGISGTGMGAVDALIQNDGVVTADGLSGTGLYAENGIVVNYNTVTANGDGGTGILTGGGDNVVVNLGGVSATGAGGIAISTGGGSDLVLVCACGAVSGDVIAIDLGAGDDLLSLGEGAVIDGLMDGGLDFDLLEFDFLSQSQLLGYSPAGGTLTYGNQTYTWANFEALIGLLMEIVEAQGGVYSGRHVWFDSGLALGLTSVDATGIDVYGLPGKFAFMPFAELARIQTGDRSGVRFQLPNSGGWFVRVYNLGPYDQNPDFDWYQVNVYTADGVLLGDQQGFAFKP